MDALAAAPLAQTPRHSVPLQGHALNRAQGQVLGQLDYSQADNSCNNPDLAPLHQLAADAGGVLIKLSRLLMPWVLARRWVACAMTKGIALQQAREAHADVRTPRLSGTLHPCITAYLKMPRGQCKAPTSCSSMAVQQSMVTQTSTRSLLYPKTPTASRCNISHIAAMIAAAIALNATVPFPQ